MDIIPIWLVFLAGPLMLMLLVMIWLVRAATPPVLKPIDPTRTKTEHEITLSNQIINVRWPLNH
jgi:hypothetical protein